MAHLNLTLSQPFSDGNGRTARCLQTAILAHEGIVSPVFSSIEEYVGRYQKEYYAVLAEVGVGGWNPARSGEALHPLLPNRALSTAQTLLRRSQEMERVYGDVANLIERYGLSQRTDLALEQAAFGMRIRNSSYRASADISNNLASRDLKSLVDAGLLVEEGEKRGREYKASPAVIAVRDSHSIRRADDNPFAPEVERANADARQPNLFDIPPV